MPINKQCKCKGKWQETCLETTKQKVRWRVLVEGFSFLYYFIFFSSIMKTLKYSWHRTASEAGAKADARWGKWKIYTCWVNTHIHTYTPKGGMGKTVFRCDFKCITYSNFWFFNFKDSEDFKTGRSYGDTWPNLNSTVLCYVVS